MIEVTLVGVETTIERFRSAPQKIYQDLVSTMQRLWYDLQNYVVSEKLSGQVLRRRTGNLASSIHAGGTDSASEFTASQMMIVGRVGTRVRYARPHEFGGTFYVKPHVRRITQVFGRPVAEHEVAVAGYNVTFPERSFLRSSMQDMSSKMIGQLADATREAMGRV